MTTVTEVNCQTGEQIERPMTAEEIANQEAMIAESAQIQAEQEQAAAIKTALKNSAKAKLVAGEPLTEEEAATIVL
jgi:hypothetical protein